MAEKIILPLDDETDDVAMRLTSKEASALYQLLSNLSRSDMLDRGLSYEQADMVDCVTHVIY